MKITELVLNPDTATPYPSGMSRRHEVDVSDPGEQAKYTFAVHEADGRPFDSEGNVKKDTGTLIVTLPWSEFVRRSDAELHYQIIAQALGKRVLAIDNLGVGEGTSTLRRNQKRALTNGDAGPVSRLQVEALQARGVFDSNELSVSGYSLGSHMGASLIEHMPEGTQVDNLVLWESVGITKQSSASLIHTFMRYGNEQNAQYLNENPEWFRQPGSISFGKQLATQGQALLSYAQLLARGPLLDSLQQAHEKGILTPETRISVLSGDRSRVSSPAENTTLTESLVRGMGSTADVHRYSAHGETHALINSKPRVISALTQLAISSSGE